MAFVNDYQEIFGEEVQQAVGAGTGSTPVKVARIILNAGAMSQFAYHFHIIGHPFLQTFGLEWAAFVFKPLHLLVKVILYFVYGTQRGFLGGHEEVGGINLVGIELGDGNAAHRVHFLNTVYLVSPKGDAQQVVGVSQINVHRIAFHAEIAAVQVNVVAYVKTVHQASQEDIATEILALLYFDDVVVEVCRIPHAVYARNGGYHHYIFPARKQGGGGGKAQLVYLVVDGEVFFYIGVR